MTKADFCRAITVLIDSREKDIAHIAGGLDAMGIAYERTKLDIGDLSFRTDARDFALSCAVERKAGPDELYGNMMEKVRPGQMNRLEKELDAGSRMLNQFVLLVEGVGGWEALRDYVVPDWQMKACPQRVVSEVGKTCYARLRAWQAANRYRFRVEFVEDRADTARRVVEEFYYYYRNYRALIAPRR